MNKDKQLQYSTESRRGEAHVRGSSVVREEENESRMRARDVVSECGRAAAAAVQVRRQQMSSSAPVSLLPIDNKY